MISSILKTYWRMAIRPDNIIVHDNNSVEINLLECAEKETKRPYFGLWEGDPTLGIWVPFWDKLDSCVENETHVELLC